MFTFGLFTTHIPYIAFVISFVYFMFSGANEVHNGKVQLSERSVWIEHQLNDLQQTACSNIDFHDNSISEQTNPPYSELILKQKWKNSRRQVSLVNEEFVAGLFSRPPPVRA